KHVAEQMPKIGMHKHIGQKLKRPEISTLNVVQSKPFIEYRQDKTRHDKDSDVDQQEILYNWGYISKHVIFRRRSECYLNPISQKFCSLRENSWDSGRQKAVPRGFPSPAH